MRWNGGTLEGPVRVVADFYLPRPKGHYGTGRNAGRVRDSAPGYPEHRPDLDKLARALLDGLGMGGAWADDCQVTHLHVSKLYADGIPPGCRVTITELEA
jgi:crossover junction endodeoxyribonuclease RusA